MLGCTRCTGAGSWNLAAALHTLSGLRNTLSSCSIYSTYPRIYSTYPRYHQSSQLDPWQQQQHVTCCIGHHQFGTAACAAVDPTPSTTSSQYRSTASGSSELCSSSSSTAHASSSSSTTALPLGAKKARVLDGKAVAAAWSSELQQQVPEISRILNRRPGLAVVLVGSRPDSLIYVARKQEACRSIGVHCRVLRLPDHVSQADLQAAVSEVSCDRAIDGVLVQLPLPPHLDEEAVMEALDPRKDVDGFHPLNMGRMLMRGRAPRFVPATPLGVVELLSRSGVSLAGKTAVVLGDSNIVGTPIAALLRDAGVALVTTCHRVSLQDWFEHKGSSQMQRAAAADVCLPRLFGPTPAGTTAQHNPQVQHTQSGCQHESQGNGSTAQHTEASPSSNSSSSSSRFQSSQLPAICRTADILVVAVGSAELVQQHWVKPGAVVVDVGINVVPLPPSAGQNSTLQHQQPHPAQHQHQHGQPNHQASHQQPNSSLQLAQGSMPTSLQPPAAPQQQQQQHHPPQQGQQQQLHQDGLDQSGQSSTSSRSCRPQVQLHLVQDGVESSWSISSDYRVVGDVAHEEVAGVASVLTPVPGGVGPMTIAAVLHNTLQAARYTAGLLRW